MRRSPCLFPVVAAIVGAVLPVMGCADNAAYLTEDRLSNGLVIILPGIEGHSRLNENIRSGLVAGGVYRAMPIHPWGRPVPLVGPLITQVDFLGNRLAGVRIAKIVTDYQDKFPDRPVYIVGHSGGGGVAVFTAEAMPEGRMIDGLVLLSASISSAYDLKKALAHCRNGIVNFYNKGDSGLLGFGTIVVGTVDGTHGPSAGLIGFDDFDKPGYEGLYQVKMVGVSEDSHTTSTQAVFVSSFVTPWVMSNNWPAGPDDAYVDYTAPLPKPPAHDIQLARNPNGKPAPGRTRAAKAPEPINAAQAAPAKAQPKPHVDESLLAAARAGSAAKQNPSPIRTHPTAAPRLPTDETIGLAGEPSGKPGQSSRSGRDGAAGRANAGTLPPPHDPEDEADPAAIAPLGGLRPAPDEESAGHPKTDWRFRRW